MVLSASFMLGMLDVIQNRNTPISGDGAQDAAAGAEGTHGVNS